MTAVEKYNALNGRTVNREELKEIMILATNQGQTTVTEKIQQVLTEFDDPEFEITVSETAVDTVPIDCLPGLDCFEPEEDFTGLEKGVSPDEIYQMITDKMIAQLKEATGTGYKKKWKKQNNEGYLIPFNFESKKQYRGINIALLTEGMSIVLKNPFFLTFKQIEKFKGKLKKGSKGLPVVYFTMLYKVSETNEAGEKIEFGTYNKTKYLNWLEKNHKRLKFSLDYYKKQYVPILKYYNVFNGADVEGIDFDLENFKIGYQDGSEILKHNDHRVQIADLIVKHYPKPQPLLKDSKDGRAFYRHSIGGFVDEIHMPKFEDFETGLDYYRTLLHEFTHSTGITSRLNRPMGGKFGSPQYAKEELVAEFGAVFLSAHAGIIWYNQRNHAEYLKNWNNVLTHAKEDNRFIMRAASKAQEAADFVLNLDKNGEPAYQKEFESAATSKIALLAKEAKKPKDVAELRAASVKEYNRKIALLDGYIILEQKQDALVEKFSLLDLEDKQRAILEKEIEKLTDAMEIQLKEGAKEFKIPKSAFLDILDLYSEDKTNIKAKLRPVIQAAKKPGKPKKKSSDKSQQLKMALAAPWHKGAAKEALSDCGRLKKGYKYTKGGEIVKVEKKKTPKKKQAKQEKKSEPVAVKKTKAELEKVNPKPFAVKPKSVAITTAIKDILTLPKFKDANERQGAIVWKYYKNAKSEMEDFIELTTPYEVGIMKKSGPLHFDHFFQDTDNALEIELTPIGFEFIGAVRNRLQSLRNQKHNYAMFDGLKSPSTVATVATVEQVQPSIETKDEFLSNSIPVNSVPPAANLPKKAQQVTPGAKSLAESMREKPASEIFNVPGDIGRFLGKVEKKPVHSVVTTLDAEQGAGKTRIFFQIMNVLAGTGKKCLFISLEEHPASKLFIDKVNQYIEPQNLNNISVIDEVENWQDVKAAIEQADIIFIDSFQKLPKLDLDNDIRKAFNGKWFFIIYQQTGTKTMRGGSQAAFDGDQILKVFKDVEDYRNNYVYANKNRYNDAPDLKLNIFTGKLIGEPNVSQDQPANSRDPLPTSGGGRLIATPVM